MQDYSLEESSPSPFSATYVARTLNAYRPAIALAVLIVAVGYAILACAAFLLAPAVRLTTLNFRLEFKGAEKGEYPNGSKFSSAEVISTPVLLRTFKENDLSRFTKFEDFAGSVYVVESNDERDALAREYQARLADTRLTSIDRERIQREYELKAGSLSKNQFSVNYARRRGSSVPDAMARKILHDILKNWADHASNEEHVLEYQVAVLSPDTIAPDTNESSNPIIATVILRGKLMRLLENIRQISLLPNSELARTKDGVTLSDIAVRLDDIVRFRLDPLVDRIAAARLDNRQETLRFIATQLAYDERVMNARQQAAETAQRTLNLYVSAQPQPNIVTAPERIASAAQEPNARPAESETVMPQINDSFIDRIIQLTTRTADTEFRQKMADDYQKASMAVVPMAQAVAYDRALLQTIQSTGGSEASIDPKAVQQELTATRNVARQLAGKVKEVHLALSRNLNPSTELLVASTPRTRIDRSISVKSLILVGILLILMTLVVASILSLFHSRIRDDRGEETRKTPATAEV